MQEIGILILDDDVAAQSAMEQVLDSEGWAVKIVKDAAEALRELASSRWTLVLVSMELVDPRGPLFATLRELSQAQAISEGKQRLRVLFLIPAGFGLPAQALLEREQLPYLLKPIHLHDFLEKVGDLLLEAGVIAEPIRQVRRQQRDEDKPKLTKRGERQHAKSMFASRDDYQMTEEEIAEYERLEAEEIKKRQKKTGLNPDFDRTL